MSAGAAVDEAVVGGARAPWKAAVAPYARPRLARTLLDVASSALPYLALLIAMYLLLDVSIVGAVALAPLAAGFLLRPFVVFPDCTPGSLFETKRANRRLGTVLGLLMYTPFESWAHSHAVHHATAGDLDRRGIGDVPSLPGAGDKPRAGGGGPGGRPFCATPGGFWPGAPLFVLLPPPAGPKVR